MRSTCFIVALIVVGCDAGPDDSVSTPAVPAAKAPPAAAKPEAEPLILKVCKAFNAEVAASDSEEMLLARSALRVTTEYGVTESELRPLGDPAQLQLAIGRAGSPKVCRSLREHLRGAARDR